MNTPLICWWLSKNFASFCCTNHKIFWIQCFLIYNLFFSIWKHTSEKKIHSLIVIIRSVECLNVCWKKLFDLTFERILNFLLHFWCAFPLTKPIHLQETKCSLAKKIMGLYFIRDLNKRIKNYERSFRIMVIMQLWMVPLKIF